MILWEPWFLVRLLCYQFIESIVVENDLSVINIDTTIPSHWFLCNFVNSLLLWLCLSYIQATFLIAYWSVIRIVAVLYLWYILLQKIVKILIFLSKHQILGSYKETLLQSHVSEYCELFNFWGNQWCFDQSYFVYHLVLDSKFSYSHKFSTLFPSTN